MLGPDHVFDLLGRSLSGRARDVDGMDARLDARDETFLRFGCSTLLQANRVRVPKVTFRAVVEGRVAEASTTTLEPSALDATRDRATALARAGGRPRPGCEMPDASGDSVVEPAGAYDAETAAATPAACAELLGGYFRRASDAGVEMAGRYVTGSVERAIVNSRGLRRYVRTTRADARFYATEGPLSGYAGSIATRAVDLPLEHHAEAAIEKCLRSRNALALDAGTYDVILEPEAVAELVEWLGSIGFTPRGVEDGTSFVAGRVGELVTGSRVSIVDNGWGEDGIGLINPFDAEGVLRKRVVLLDAGIARGVVHDTATGRKSGCQSTGHAVSAEESFGGGPVPGNLFFAAGTDTAADLLGRVERGLWVTSFHYVNGLLDPRKAVMTGLTRHGTFVIDDGRLGRGIQNLRFTDSILDAFTRIDGVTAERAAVPTWWSALGASVAPTLLIRGLRFTGTTAET